jgi:predicted ester cyclase
LDRMIAEDDIVVERFTASGTHLGELMGVPGTGGTIVLRGINVFRIADGKIVERWGQLDQLGVLHQLGLAPA